MASRHIVRSSSIVLMGAVFAAPATAQFADGELIRLAPISVTATRNPIRAFGPLSRATGLLVGFNSQDGD